MEEHVKHDERYERPRKSIADWRPVKSEEDSGWEPKVDSKNWCRSCRRDLERSRAEPRKNARPVA